MANHNCSAWNCTHLVLIDTHAHLDFPQFQQDLDAVLERAAAAGVSKIITIGTDIESSRRAVALAEKHPQIHAVVGWHPGHVLEAPEDIRPALKELARHPKVAAIGETGLDHYRLPSSQGGTLEQDEIYRLKQKQIFLQQLEVASELGLNCVIHTRESMEATLELFRPFASRVRGVFHCFISSIREMETVISLGSLVSYTGIVTFKNATDVLATAVATPAGRFMIETDCPFLAPVPNRGKRCEPAYVRQVGEKLAQARGIALEELGEMSSRTAREFFRGL